MPRSLTPPRSPRPRRKRTLVVAFREEQPVGPRIIDSRGSITSPEWVAAWSSRCLRFATVLADGPARRASPWGAGPSAAGIAPAPRHELSRRTLLFPGVHGDHGWVGRLRGGGAGRDVLELGLAVGMRGPAFHHLAGRLEAEADRVPQTAHGGGTHRVACCCRAAAHWAPRLPVHRHGDSGSPRVVGSTNASHAAASVGCVVVFPPRGRPPGPNAGSRRDHPIVPSDELLSASSGRDPSSPTDAIPVLSG